MRLFQYEEWRQSLLIEKRATPQGKSANNKRGDVESYLKRQIEKRVNQKKNPSYRIG